VVAIATTLVDISTTLPVTLADVPVLFRQFLRLKTLFN